MRKVIRVTNRLLLAKYEENILCDIDEFDYINNKPSLRKKVDYLMYCWRPKNGDHFEELFDIIKYGFKDPSKYKVPEFHFLNQNKIRIFFNLSLFEQENGYEEAIPFSNSMSVCDHHRIEACKANAPNKTNNMAFKHGN